MNVHPSNTKGIFQNVVRDLEKCVPMAQKTMIRAMVMRYVKKKAGSAPDVSFPLASPFDLYKFVCNEWRPGNFLTNDWCSWSSFASRSAANTGTRRLPNSLQLSSQRTSMWRTKLVRRRSYWKNLAKQCVSQLSKE